MWDFMSFIQNNSLHPRRNLINSFCLFIKIKEHRLKLDKLNSTISIVRVVAFYRVTKAMAYIN